MTVFNFQLAVDLDSSAMNLSAADQLAKTSWGVDSLPPTNKYIKKYILKQCSDAKLIQILRDANTDFFKAYLGMVLGSLPAVLGDEEVHEVNFSIMSVSARCSLGEELFNAKKNLYKRVSGNAGFEVIAQAFQAYLEKHFFPGLRVRGYTSLSSVIDRWQIGDIESLRFRGKLFQGKYETEYAHCMKLLENEKGEDGSGSFDVKQLRFSKKVCTDDAWKSAHLLKFNGELKVIQVILELLKKSESLKPGESLLYTISDDRVDILSEITRVFRKYPFLLPENIRLNMIHYSAITTPITIQVYAGQLVSAKPSNNLTCDQFVKLLSKLTAMPLVRAYIHKNECLFNDGRVYISPAVSLAFSAVMAAAVKLCSQKPQALNNLDQDGLYQFLLKNKELFKDAEVIFPNMMIDEPAKLKKLAKAQFFQAAPSFASVKNEAMSVLYQRDCYTDLHL